MAHQADAPDLTLEIAQAAADLDAEIRQQFLAHAQVIDSGRNADGIELGQLMAFDRGIGQTQGAEAGFEGAVMALMAGPARFEAFFQYQPQALAQSIDHGDWGGMVIKTLRIPVTRKQSYVQIPALHLGLAASDRLLGTRAERNRRES